MRETTMETEVVCFGRFGSSKSFVEYAALRATRCYASRSATRDAALRATTNPGASKDRLCRSGGDLPPPGLRLPPSRDALRSRLAGAGASPPPFRASSPRRDTNAAFAAHETSRNSHPRRTLNRAFAAKAACMAQRPCRAFREVSCAAKAAFRVWRQDETRRVATEISRRQRQRLEAGRGIDGANRRQAIRPAAGFVVARSASRSGSEGHFANRRSLTSTALAVRVGLRVPAENTPRTRTAGALCHDPAITCRKRQSGQIARANAPESARRATSAPHYIDTNTQTTALLPRIRLRLPAQWCV